MYINSRKYGKIEFEVDKEDIPLLLGYQWCVSKESRGSANNLFYVVGFKPPRKKGLALIRLHRLIMSALPGQVVDHIDGNGLNNKRSNLRLLNHKGNMQNSRKRKNATSKYKGVSWNTRKGLWRSRLYTSGVTQELGYYSDEEEAAKEYDKALEETGSLSPRNFPKSIADLK